MNRLNKYFTRKWKRRQHGTAPSMPDYFSLWIVRKAIDYFADNAILSGVSTFFVQIFTQSMNCSKRLNYINFLKLFTNKILKFSWNIYIYIYDMQAAENTSNYNMNIQPIEKVKIIPQTESVVCIEYKMKKKPTVQLLNIMNIDIFQIPHLFMKINKKIFKMW